MEFAFVLLPFVTLVFGAIDFGWAVNHDVLVNNAAREGAREGSLNPDQGDIEAVVHASPGGADTTVAVSCRKPSGATCASIASATPGDTVIVTVALDHDWITPVGGALAPGGVTLTKTAEMRIE
ncbi:TadE/TadG family type IV pilus assembly protein [Nocardioides sp. 31GB23]|uniref:TadE/TadG family type IV pilus assembly protein n=1 Tax=Nocardioides sp. 31GB23 TaxID=3156065 RepID=UPI0032AE95D6